jgi:hypothetical protein
MDDGMTEKVTLCDYVTRISSIPNKKNSNGQMIEFIKLTNNKNNVNYDCWLFPSL